MFSYQDTSQTDRRVSDNPTVIRAQNHRLNRLVSDYDDDDEEIYVNNSGRNFSLGGNDIETIRVRLQYFFMDPLRKWEKKNTRPWKLLVQVVKLILFTSQLVLFGSDMSKFITYKDEMQTTFKQLFLKDWDPAADAIAYPGPYIPYAVYTKPDFLNTVEYAVKIFSNVSNLSVGPLGYQSDDPSRVSPIEFCMDNYVQAEFEPTHFKYNYSMYTVTVCKIIENFAAAGSADWLNFNITQFLNQPINFSTLITSTLRLPIRTLIIEDTASGDAEVVCFNVDIYIYFDNQHRDGQITINLISNPKRAQCNGRLTNTSDSKAMRLTLNVLVISFCTISFILCVRSLINAMKLMKLTLAILKAHGHSLIWGDRVEFIDPWLVLIIINDILIAAATMIIMFYNDRLLETNNYTTCSLLIGLGNFLSWSGLLRYLSFFKKYNLLIVTLRKSFSQVVRFMICTLLIYCGFCFCGWVVFGPYHFKFRQLSTTTECLFALLNGDDMFETFALLRSDMGSIWWFSRIYLYVFVSLFIYVVLSLFIALIMDAYEIIKQYGDNGFPKTGLQSFYLDGDLSKLAMTTR